MLRSASQSKNFLRSTWKRLVQSSSVQTSAGGKPVVNSYNEWDPLEEVVVGVAEGQRVPALHNYKGQTKLKYWDWVRENAGKPHDPEVVAKAEAEVAAFCQVLQHEGVTVRRPEAIRWDQLGKFRTPYFEEGGYMNACPRDGLMVVGNEIIETPLAWRGRVFEYYAYKKLFMDYFRRGARWTSAPRPAMSDELYDKDYPYQDEEKRAALGREGKYSITEVEPCLDAASAMRFGKDIFVELSQVTNRSGVEWLRRHLAPRGINVHSFIYEGTTNCHVDVVLIPIKPGVLLVNPTSPCLKINDVPTSWDYFTKRGWTVVESPHPVLCTGSPYVSEWIMMNILSLDENRVIMQKGEEPLKRLLQDKLGMKTIELDMRHAYTLGGGFHCWTLDVRRRGDLKSYL